MAKKLKPKEKKHYILSGQLLYLFAVYQLDKQLLFMSFENNKELI